MTVLLASMTWFVLAVAQEPGGLRWPVGSGTEPYPLRATYGQFEGCFEPGNSSGDLHLGLDILYRTPEREFELVKALEAGTVKRVRRHSIDYSAVVIESKSVSERAFLYLHLDRHSIEVEVGDEVSVGQTIGRIAYSNADTEEPHLHLSRLRRGYKSHTWSDMDQLSSCNPLKLLKPEYLGDAEDPVVTPLADSARLVVRVNESQVVPAGGSSTPMDVLIRAYDKDPLSSHLLAPYEFELSVTTGSVTKPVSRLTLDGELGQTTYDALYNVTGEHRSWGDTRKDKYVYYFVSTNGDAPDGDSLPATANAWDASSGDHVLHLLIRDAKGNSTTIDQSISIP